MSLVSSSVDIINTLTESLRDYKIFEIRMWLELSGFDLNNLLIVPLFVLRELVKFLIIITMAFFLLISSCFAMNKLFPVEHMNQISAHSARRSILSSDGDDGENVTSVWDMGEDDEKGTHIHHKATQTQYKPHPPISQE